MPKKQGPADADHLSEPSQPKVSLADSTPLMLPLDSLPGIPPFQPARGLKNPHLQTMYGVFRPGLPTINGTVQRHLRFADGDVAILHDDKPASWDRGDHVVLMMHGLAGCHQSGYMGRISSRLQQRNVRVFRMDHRGCGAGKMLAKNPYNAGRIRDVEAAIRMLERLCPGSPISIAGFSLSGNLLLRYLSDQPDTVPLSVFRAVAVCPPIDLQFCVEKLGSTRMGRRYDRYFARQLINQIVDTPQWNDDLPLANVHRAPSRLIDFDDLYTAPASGFASAAEYYDFASAKPRIGEIRVHTSVLVSDDDPMVSAVPWLGLSLPPNITLCMTKAGGHLGFVGRKGVDADNRWMDWRVVDWLLN